MCVCVGGVCVGGGGGQGAGRAGRADDVGGKQ